MAIVASTAAALVQLKKSFGGRIRFIFQPAEEKPPGGARELLKAGVMHKPKVDMIFGLHTNPAIPVGKIGIRGGALMAGVLDFDIEITGRGGHSGLPHLSNDTVVCISDLVTRLQTIVSRNIDPCEPTVLSIGRIEGGTARNVLPSSCKLYGTARALSALTLRKLGKRIRTMTRATARAYNCEARIDFHDSYPPVINDTTAVSYLAQAAAKVLGARAVTVMNYASMGGEDFARYLEYAPGAMFHLGTANRSIGASYGWHHPKFTIDENSMTVGIKTLVQAAVDYLND
jgi:amidohydrolase